MNFNQRCYFGLSELCSIKSSIQIEKNTRGPVQRKKNQVKVGNKLKVNDQSYHVHSNWLIFFFLISDFHTKFLMNVAQMHKRLSRPP